MKLKHIFATGAAVLALVGASPASAAILMFDFSGPSGTAQFELDSNPTPDFSSTFLGSNQFGFNDVMGTFGGVPGSATTISFGDGIFASFNIVAPNLGFTQFSSPTLFSGTADSPMFLTGTFQLINPFFGNGTLTISESAAAVPEPASWAMMLLGFGFVGGAMRFGKHRSRQKLTITYS